MRLPAYLILMAIAILVPVVGFYALALNMLENAERATAFRHFDEKTKSISYLVERELYSSKSALNELARSAHLKNGDMAAFYEQAKFANHGRNAWTLLLDKDGRQILNTVVPFGAKLPPLAEPGHAQKVFSSGQSLVIAVIRDPATKNPVTTLNVPVYLKNGERFVVVAAFDSNRFTALLESSEFPETWVATIFDKQGNILAQTRNRNGMIGNQARPDLIKAHLAQGSGITQLRSNDGVEIYNTLRKIPLLEWTVAIAAPAEQIDAAAIKATKLAGAGMLGGILIATLLAYALGGRIVRSIKYASEAAADLGRGETPRFGHSNIVEINRLYRALRDAGEQLAQEQASRSKAETKATEAGARLEFAVNAADLGTFFCPVPLKEINWNATCKRHFFLPADAEIDFDVFYNLIHPEDREHTRYAVETAVYQGESYDVEYRAMAPDGRTRWLRAKGRAYYDTAGSPTHFDGITIDISRTKEVEERLQRISRQKDDFLAMLAHELRNPLAPISAAASLLRMPGVDLPLVASTTEIIARQVDHMAELLNDLLDVSRVTRGIIDLKRDAVDVKRVIACAAEQVNPLMRARAHQFSMELLEDSAYVFGDEKRLIQIVVNLLVNAAKYTSNGGIIKLTLSGKQDDIFIAIRDNGIGMTEDLIGGVFDLFVQGERTPDRQQGGLGIGLALVKSLVELHTGEVSVTSDGAGQGCVFTVRLPRYGAPEKLNEHAIGRPFIYISPAPLKVMIVDDNTDAMRTLSLYLNALGYDVHEESNPHEALKMSCQVKPDVFILDIGMPGMDGNELARRLRSNAVTKTSLFIAVSGYGQAQDKRLTAETGFDFHLVKPVDMRMLLGILEKTGTR